MLLLRHLMEEKSLLKIIFSEMTHLIVWQLGTYVLQKPDTSLFAFLSQQTQEAGSSETLAPLRKVNDNKSQKAVILILSMSFMTWP
jgi:hypothetical protein